MLNNKLNETKIGNAKVIIDILPSGKVIPNTKINPTSITIHMTGNIDTTAKNNHNYMKNCNKNGNRIASWHFTVDDKEIYQAQSTNYKCYHAGTSMGNNTSIGVEICMFTDKTKQLQAYKNAIELVKILMTYHKFSVDKVKRHYDWSGKYCPIWLIEGKWGYTWNWFKNQLIAKPIEQPMNVPFLATIIVDELNIRKEADFNSEIVGVVKKNNTYTIIEVKNGLGRLASGIGWISINEKYVIKKPKVQEFQQYTVKILVDTLNIRQDAGTSYAIVGTVKKGQVFTIVEEKNGWLKLKSGIGYISGNTKYVQKV